MKTPLRTKAEFDNAFPVPSDPAGIVEAFVTKYRRYGEHDLQGDRIVRGAYSGFLKRVRDNRVNIPVFVQHDYKDPSRSLVGAIPFDGWTDTEYGLKARLLLDIENNRSALGIFRLVQRGLLTSTSIGFEVGREHQATDGINEITSLDPREVSIVVLPADQGATILSAKSESGVYAGSYNVARELADIDANCRCRNPMCGAYFTKPRVQYPGLPAFTICPSCDQVTIDVSAAKSKAHEDRIAHAVLSHIATEERRIKAAARRFVAETERWLRQQTLLADARREVAALTKFLR